MNYKKVLEQLNYWREVDTKQYDAFVEYMAVIAPDSYAPVTEPSLVDAYLSAFDEEERDWLEYYIYEAVGMEEATVKSNGKTYNFKNDEEVIHFLNEEYN